MWSESYRAMRGLPRPLWMLFAGTFINRFGGFVVPFLTLHLKDVGHTIAEAGFAASAYGLGHLVASLLGGHLTDYFGRRNTIILSMFTSAALVLMLSQAQALWAVVTLVGLFGLAGELYRPAASALIADLTTPAQRLHAFAGYRIAINAGFMLGPAVAGVLSQAHPMWLFVGDAVTSVVYGILAWATLPNIISRHETPAPWSEALAHLRANTRFLLFLLAVAPVTFIFFQLNSTFPLHAESHGVSRAGIGLLLGFNGLLVIVMEVPLTTWVRRKSLPLVLGAGYLLIGFGYASNAFLGTATLMVLGMFVFTLGEMIIAPLQSAHIAELAPQRLRGRYMGIYSLVWSLGLMTAPWLGTMAFQRDPNILWAACALLGILAAIMVVIATREPSKR